MLYIVSVPGLFVIVCSCFHWKHSVCTTTVCRHKCSSLFFLVDFQRCRNYKRHFSKFTGSLRSLYLIDRQGRQRLIIGSYLGMVQAISMFLVVSAISFPINEDLRSYLSILGIILYILTYAIGPVLLYLNLEVAEHVCNFMIGLFFLELVEKFGVAPVYGNFGAVSLLAALFS